jgi:hypothetical protein
MLYTSAPLDARYFCACQAFYDRPDRLSCDLETMLILTPWPYEESCTRRNGGVTVYGTQLMVGAMAG